MMQITFYDDEIYTLGAALELAMSVCEDKKDYKLADRFAEAYRVIDELVRGVKKE